MQNTNNNAAIQQLLRNFGGQLDREVLESVLEICGGNVQQATTFLQVQNNDDYVEPPPSASGGPSLPPDYMNKPPNFIAPSEANESESSSAFIDKMKRVFLSDTSFLEHLNLREKEYSLYTAVLLLFIEKNIDLGTNAKARVLAAAWHHRDMKLAHYLLSRKQQFQLPEILKAIRILDAPRRIRALEKRIARLEKQGTAKARTIGLVRAKINDAKNEVPGAGEQTTSVTGALAKKVRQWAKTIAREDLQFYALQLPKEPWRELADIVHFNPSDFQLEWFLYVVFDAPPPEDSLITQAKRLTADNVAELIATYHFPYSYLRKQIPELSPEAKAEVSKYEKLDTLIWYYEELSCPQVDAIISERLDQGEQPQFSYGKLMERLLYFKMSGTPFFDKLIPIAEARLQKIRLPLEPPVLVLGDASYSMDVAIRTATIIGSLLAALTNAELKFFNVNCFAPSVMPRNIHEVLECATNTKADGLTAPACSLWDYYKNKEVVKFFIVVTDEIENEKSKGEFFAQLFYKYYTEVYPAKIVFVSFLEVPTEKGRMVRALENLGIIPLQFRLDGHRPDLTKVDTLLAQLFSECNFFTVQVDALVRVLAHGRGDEEEGGPSMKDEVFDAVMAALEDLPFPTTIASQGESGGDEEKEEGKGKERNIRKSTNENEAPEEFICPISQEVMDDPVVASDGHTYSRKGIEDWLQRKLTSPITGEELESAKLYPNYHLRSKIKEWLEVKK